MKRCLDCNEELDSKFKCKNCGNHFRPSVFYTDLWKRATQLTMYCKHCGKEKIHEKPCRHCGCDK